jgi:branched-chain amino acid transport system ATP-binding protein
MACLSIDSVSKFFGGLKALDNVTFSVNEGELVGLIGPNGSGKTTLLNILSGYLSADSGDVVLDGRPINGLRPEALARLGVLRMFQLTRVFPRMSVLDNLLVTGSALGLPEAEADGRARELIEDLTLTRMMHLDAGQLSGGQRKLLEFGSCFMVPPRIALLDEPFAAVHPTMKEIMAGVIRRRDEKTRTVLTDPVVIEAYLGEAAA